MSEQLAIWRAEHINYARLLDLLETQLAAFHGGERPNYDLMVDIVEYLRSFPDRFHHPREDVAFGLLVEREPGMLLLINRLLQEHRVIAIAGDELLSHLGEASVEAVFRREALEAAVATFLVYFRHHLSTEEREVMPRLAQILGPEDWAKIDAAVTEGPDPLFGKQVEARFRELRRETGL